MANQGFITGRITEQVEVRTSQSGNAWAEFNVDVDVKSRGDWVTRRIPFKAFGETATTLEQLNLPAKVGIVYRVDLDEWEYKGKGYSKVQLLCFELLPLAEVGEGSAETDGYGI